MKIALIRKRYTPYGGAEKYFSRLVAGLCRYGHEVHILAKHWEELPDLHTQLYFRPLKVISSVSFLESLTFALAAYRVVQKEEFDVIHSFDRTYGQDVYRAGDGCHREWLKQRKKIEPWFKGQINYLNPNHLAILYLEKKLFKSPCLKYVIANSQRGKMEIVQHYGLTETKIKVIYNGVDLQQFDPKLVQQKREAGREKWGLEKDDLVFLFIGSGFERKGLPFLLQALSLLDKNMKLLVVGKDGLQKYREHCHRLGLENRVLFLGPQKDVEIFYGISDYFVLPSIYEPFSNACVEALASGLPVITSEINGAAELIKEEENGLLIHDPTNIWEIKDKLQEALKIWGKECYREKIREISPLSTIESNVQDILRIYAKVSESKRKNVD